MGVCIVKRNRKKQLKKQSMAAGSKDRKEKLFFLVTMILMVIYLLWRIFSPCRWIRASRRWSLPCC